MQMWYEACKCTCYFDVTHFPFFHILTACLRSPRTIFPRQPAEFRGSQLVVGSANEIQDKPPGTLKEPPNFTPRQPLFATRA